eukprot:7128443-Prymnesium_polylepis.1
MSSRRSVATSRSSSCERTRLARRASAAADDSWYCDCRTSDVREASPAWLSTPSAPSLGSSTAESSPDDSSSAAKPSTAS